MKDISIDCESLGIRFSAPVIAIAAQVFDRDTGKMGQTFHQNVELGSALRAGRIEVDTLKWWMTQSDSARKVFQDTNVERYALQTVLQEFTTFVRKIGVPRVYFRGPLEDGAWLTHSYDSACIGLKEGWHYQNVRDIRTIIDMAQVDENEIKFIGEKHNALADATHQARVVIACYQKVNAALKGKKPEPISKPQIVEEEEL